MVTYLQEGLQKYLEDYAMEKVYMLSPDAVPTIPALAVKKLLWEHEKKASKHYF